MWVMLYLLSTLANAEPKPKPLPAVEGLLEVQQCLVVAESLEMSAKGYEWSNIQGEYLRSGVAACTITLKKHNHEIVVAGTVVNGVFTVLADGESLVATGGEDDNLELV